MTFHWSLYVSFADLLARSPICGDDVATKGQEVQASYRAALSRAYYGLFGSAYNYLRDVEHDAALLMWLQIHQGASFPPDEVERLKDETKSIHEYVLKRLKIDLHDKRKNGLRKGLRQTLSTLKERRIEADYREGPTFDSRTVKLEVDHAKEALGYLAKLCQ
jgi:hypothetical protein